MSDKHDEWEPQRSFWQRDVWDSPLLLIGGGMLMLLILVGVTLFFLLKREHVAEPPPPPSVEVSPAPVDVRPVPFEPFLLFACAVGIWLLVVLVAILVWLVWIRLPAREDTREPPSTSGKPPPSTI